VVKQYSFRSKRDPNAVPKEVTKLQIVRALRQFELAARFKSALAAAGEITQEDWQLAVSIRRNDPMVKGFAALLELTEDQLDDLFRLAATL